MNISRAQLKSMYFHVILNNHTSKASDKSIMEHMEDLGLEPKGPSHEQCLSEAIADFRVVIEETESNAPEPNIALEELGHLVTARWADEIQESIEENADEVGLDPEQITVRIVLDLD